MAINWSNLIPVDAASGLSQGYMSGVSNYMQMMNTMAMRRAQIMRDTAMAQSYQNRFPAGYGQQQLDERAMGPAGLMYRATGDPRYLAPFGVGQGDPGMSGGPQGMQFDFSDPSQRAAQPQALPPPPQGFPGMPGGAIPPQIANAAANPQAVLQGPQGGGQGFPTPPGMATPPPVTPQAMASPQAPISPSSQGSPTPMMNRGNNMPPPPGLSALGALGASGIGPLAQGNGAPPGMPPQGPPATQGGNQITSTPPGTGGPDAAGQNTSTPNWFSGQPIDKVTGLPLGGQAPGDQMSMMAKDLAQRSWQQAQMWGNAVQNAANPIQRAQAMKMYQQYTKDAMEALTSANTIGKGDIQGLQFLAGQGGKASMGQLDPTQYGSDIRNYVQTTGRAYQTPEEGYNFGLSPADYKSFTAAVKNGQTTWNGKQVSDITGGAQPYKMADGSIGFVDQNGELLDKPQVAISPEGQARIAQQGQAVATAKARQAQSDITTQLLTKYGGQLDAAKVDALKAQANLINNGTLPMDKANMAQKALWDQYMPGVWESEIARNNANAAHTNHLGSGGPTPATLNQVYNNYLKPQKDMFGMSLPAMLITDQNGNLAVNPKFSDQDAANNALSEAVGQLGGRYFGHGQVNAPMVGDASYGGNYRQVIAQTAAKYGVDPYAVQAIIKHESGGNPDAFNKNPNGTTDHGIMQVNSATKNPASYNWRDPATNIDAGVAEFAQKLKQAGGDYKKAFWYYNGTGAPMSKYAAPVYNDYLKLKSPGSQSAPSAGGPKQASSSNSRTFTRVGDNKPFVVKF